MKATDYCIECLKGLALNTIELSCGDLQLFKETESIIYSLYKHRETPPEIANTVLRHIKLSTGVYDPYFQKKAMEFEKAKQAFEVLKDIYRGSLEGALKLSALGNSLDYFIHYSDGFNPDNLNFQIDVDKIEEEIYIKGKEIVILGDNVGDFIFDTALVECLQDMGKQVYYVVKGHPVQNDLSWKDVEMFGFLNVNSNIISNGTDEVGMKKKHITGKIKELWESDAMVIAKGMGNYETISEYHGERPVIHIMKVKCPAVSKNLGHEIGTYLAILS